MYFNANLSVNPSQARRIERVKPERAFKRILYFMTLGAVSDEREVESFTAVSVLQQFYRVFQSLGISNLVRLSHNDLDFYLDTEGRDEDLKTTLDRYDLETGAAMSETFEQLRLVLEHEEGSFRYLINLEVNRSHAVGVHPIDIYIDGLLLDFRGQDGEALKRYMAPIFESQSRYEDFVRSKEQEFEGFLSRLQYELRKQMALKQLDLEFQPKLLIPKAKPEPERFQGPVWQNGRHHNPVYHGYHGVNNDLLYLWLWTDMCHSQQISVAQTHLVSEDGVLIQAVGAEGLAAHESPLFDTSSDFDSRLSEAGFHYDAESGDYFSDPSMADGRSSTSSWWSSGSEDGSGGDSGGDGGSSCSSCSSCGGCGGCGG